MKIGLATHESFFQSQSSTSSIDLHFSTKRAFGSKMASSSKRVRKANYTQTENLFLAEKYEEFRELLDAKHKGSSTNKLKKDAWEKIWSQHDARFPGTNRTVEDLRNRLSKLKSESRDRLSEYKRSRAATGGGEHPDEPSPAQQKILDICENTPSFQGLHGVESGSMEVMVSSSANENSDDGKHAYFLSCIKN